MMNLQNQKLWLKWNTILKKIQHLRFDYVGTEDKEIIEDMIQYIKVLMKRIKKDE
jgi:hypothetical protein|tara:strand:- start:1669 stop:1833 length:165 start_codon:yes stop_codon:yes gene_type:complete